MPPQQMQHARYRNQHGDAVPLDDVGDARGIELVREVDLSAQESRRPQAHELAEDVAQRQRVQKAQRMKRPLESAILRDLTLNRIERDQDVAMRMHNPA